MIKIRYRDPNELSPGLHAEAERSGRCTTVYLLSGLTKRERRAALRRLRLSARMGYCPSLPAPQLALALFKDRIRTGAGQTGAVFRLHPAGSTVPVMVLSGGAIAFLLLSTVSIRVLHQRPPGEPAAAGTPPIAMASALPNPAGLSRGLPGAGLGNQGVGSSPAADIGPGFNGPAVNLAPSVGRGIGSNTGTGTTGTDSTGTDSTGTDSTGTDSTGTDSTGTDSTGTDSTGTDSTGTDSTGTDSSATGGTATGGSGTDSSTTGSSGNGGTSESSGSSGTSSFWGGTSSGGSTSTGGAAAATTPAPTATTYAATSSSSGCNGSRGSRSGCNGRRGGVCLDVGPLGVCLNV
jgi:hypothetical protein